MQLECPILRFSKNLFHGDISSGKRNFENMLFKKKDPYKPDSSKKFLGNRALWPSDGGVNGSVSPFNGQTRRNLQTNISKEEKN